MVQFSLDLICAHELIPVVPYDGGQWGWPISILLDTSRLPLASLQLVESWALLIASPTRGMSSCRT
jgi:hypothetical protein